MDHASARDDARSGLLVVVDGLRPRVFDVREYNGLAAAPRRQLEGIDEAGNSSRDSGR